MTIKMTPALRTAAIVLLKIGAGLFFLNEVRGLILAGPVLYGIYQAGGTLMALWVGFCSLAGIVLSVVVPLIVARRLKRRTAKQA